MKKISFLIIFICIGGNLISQTPFVTYGTPSPEKVKNKFYKKYGVSITAANDIQIRNLREENMRLNANGDSFSIRQNVSKITNNDKTIRYLEQANERLIEKLVEEDLNKADFLDHMNANIVFVQNGKKMFPTINGEVINYKLSLWTSWWSKKGSDTIYKRRHYLPISLFTKISGNYSDSAAGPSDDAASYFGAPLTLRFSPAHELFKGKLGENKLFVGLNTDIRLLTIGDTIKNKFQTTWGVYASAGISYMGRGYAYEGQDDTDEANRYEGIWSFSAMLYFFKSGGEYSKAVFGNYEKKTLSGVELLLRFKTSKKEDAKFNFLIGASNCFTKGVPNSGSWQFRLGIGS